MLRTIARYAAAAVVIGGPLAALAALPSPERYSLELERRGEVYVLDHGLSREDCAREMFNNLASDPESSISCRSN